MRRLYKLHLQGKSVFMPYFLVCIFLWKILVACQHLSPSHREKDPISNSAHVSSVPEPKKKIVLILGPGMAKSYAHLGLLQTLEKEKIPMRALVGLGWGAIIAAFHLQGDSEGLFWAEWQMLKFSFKAPWKNLFRKRASSPSLKKVHYFMEKHLPLLSPKEDSKEMRDFACPYMSLLTEEVYWEENRAPSRLLPCLAVPSFFLPHRGKYIPALFEFPKVIEWVQSRYGKEAYLVFINPLSFMTAKARRRLLKDMGGEGLLLRQQLYRQILDHRSQWDHYFEMKGGEDLVWSDFSQKRKNIALGRKLGKVLSEQLHRKYGF